jgi:hypothetical protein
MNDGRRGLDDATLRSMLAKALALVDVELKGGTADAA